MVHGAEADRVALPRDVADAAVKILAKQRAKPNFGNAGAATALLSRAKEVPDDVSSFFFFILFSSTYTTISTTGSSERLPQKH